MASETLNPSTWNRKTNGGIPYRVLEGYPTITGDEGKASATEKYIIRASDVEAFYTESLPAPVVYLGSVYWPPRRKMPGAPILITRTITFAPHNGTMPGDPFDVDSGNAASYDQFYDVTIQYETLENESDQEQDPNDPETFLEHSVTAAGEFMSWPPTKTQTSPGDVTATPGAGSAPNEDIMTPIVKTVPTLEHILKWKNCLAPNWTRIIGLLGHVSDRTEPLFFNAKRETVLFMGVSGTQSYLWNGASVGVQPWTLDFRFSCKAITEGGSVYGWNHVYSPKHGEWRRLYRADGTTLHKSSNLRTLFTP